MRPNPLLSKAVRSAGISAMVCLSVTSCQRSNPGESQPNVILVITDDQGYGDLSCHGNPVLRTPSLHKLYKDSYRFTDFHVGTTCAPTRAGLMTGRNANRNGVWHTVGGCSILNPDELTLAGVFQANGYATAMFGKWHLGDNEPYLPHNRGFDLALYHGGGGIGQTPDYWMNDYFDDTYFQNGVPVKKQGYCTDVWFGECIDFIKNNQANPFFCYLSPNAPHSPYNLPPEYYEAYRNEAIPEMQKRFYGMIANLDDNMARLMETLKNEGLESNTLLIFMTDNGTSAGYLEKEKGEGYHGFNAGMRGIKGSHYEGGHRVPFFMHWPGGGINGGKDMDGLAAHVDILPTLAELCRLEFETVHELEGISLAKWIKGEEEPDSLRMLITDTQRIQWPEEGRNSCVMQSHWRLISGAELYHVRRDPGQENDLSEQYPEKAREMKAFYHEWWKRVEEEAEYSAIPVGVTGSEPVLLTAHDIHAPASEIPWNQDLVRLGSKSAEGFYLIEVMNSGNYRFELSRWPFESGLALEDSVQGVEAEYYREAIPPGKKLLFREAIVSVNEQQSYSAVVDNRQPFATVDCLLEEGMHQIWVYFKTEEENQTGAYYVRVQGL